MPSPVYCDARWKSWQGTEGDISAVERLPVAEDALVGTQGFVSRLVLAARLSAHHAAVPHSHFESFDKPCPAASEVFVSQVPEVPAVPAMRNLVPPCRLSLRPLYLASLALPHPGLGSSSRLPVRSCRYCTLVK